ncbi:MAG: LytTR family transcriptional regulator DNA-binding domain-containing protein [Bacteroidales bacterium]|nr:LytTR family transcriptional regulator DNA-binding domain-containing protein [Bacteroidales bacterium]
MKQFLMEKQIVISKGTELFQIPARRLVYISSDGNYSNAVTQDGRSLLLSYQLGQLEDIIADQLGETGFDFVRLGRKLIVNMDFVHYVDVAKQQLILSDCAGCRHELSASREVLVKLKAYIEASTRND